MPQFVTNVKDMTPAQRKAYLARKRSKGSNINTTGTLNPNQQDAANRKRSLPTQIEVENEAKVILMRRQAAADQRLHDQNFDRA